MRHQQLFSDSMFAPVPASAAAVNATSTVQVDRAVILKALTLLSSQPGVIDHIIINGFDLVWSTQGFPISAFAQVNALSSENNALIGLYPGQTAIFQTTLDAAGVIRGAWGTDDIRNDSKLAVLIDSLVNSGVEPGNVKWLFGMGRQAIGAGVTATFTATAKAPGNGPGALVADIPAGAALGDLELIDVQIGNKSQLVRQGAAPLEAFTADNFNRCGLYIGKQLANNTPVSVTVRNNSAGALPVGLGFIRTANQVAAELTALASRVGV
tara:strand:+ start:167 stop:970 length:804 start_codon:yes stop_codon:yes gene_type:complete